MAVAKKYDVSPPLFCRCIKACELLFILDPVSVTVGDPYRVEPGLIGASLQSEHLTVDHHCVANTIFAGAEGLAIGDGLEVLAL